MIAGMPRWRKPVAGSMLKGDTRVVNPFLEWWRGRATDWRCQNLEGMLWWKNRGQHKDRNLKGVNRMMVWLAWLPGSATTPASALPQGAQAEWSVSAGTTVQSHFHELPRSLSVGKGRRYRTRVHESTGPRRMVVLTCTVQSCLLTHLAAQETVLQGPSRVAGGTRGGKETKVELEKE